MSNHQDACNGTAVPCNIQHDPSPLTSQLFLYRSKDVTGLDRGALQTEILSLIDQKGRPADLICTRCMSCTHPHSTAMVATGMAGTYEKVCTEFGWPLDSTKLSTMQAANTAKLEELEGTIKDAEENLGDTEVWL